MLLLTYSWHFHSGPLLDRLRAAGLPALRLDQDDLDGRVSLALAPGGGRLTLDGVSVDLAGITGVFAPKGVRATTGEDEQMARWVASERSAALRALHSRLRHARHLYPGVGVEPDKLAGLDAAKAAGLAIPETLYTDDPEAARAFAARFPAVVAKLHEPLSQSMDGSGPNVSTVTLSAEDVEALDTLAACPMIFQERVPKAYEVRAAVVGARVYAARIALLDQDADAVDDWRHAAGEARWEAVALGEAVDEALVAAHRALGLHFGAVDLIVRPDGEALFLETNPHGEWWMLQDGAGLDVLGGMVDFLRGVPS